MDKQVVKYLYSGGSVSNKKRITTDTDTRGSVSVLYNTWRGSRSHVQLFVTPRTIQSMGFSSCSFLQGIFPTQGSNPGLLHCRWIIYQGSPWDNVSGSQNHYTGILLEVQWLRLHDLNVGAPGLIPGQGTRAHMPQLKFHMPQLKISPATANTRHSQINKNI